MAITDLDACLRKIAEQLWRGQGSIMIGAGLSMNAKNIINPNHSMPNWSQIGDVFYSKLYSKAPDSSTRYLSILKLAEEYQAVFGRNALDDLIKKHISDGDYEPSELHIRLMELPWVDVFTTNYDTLLERSCENVLSRRYDLVVNQDDLIQSSKPRIVKLHGSLPSTRPFIITEEDYRIYPRKYAPFVNTVQQSLLENTLCLIGFSGHDPNFLQWVGWINDNIGKENAPKIYLIGVLNLTDAQTKLLHNKNIIKVNLAECIEDKKDHKKGLEFFIEYLEGQKGKNESLLWPKDINLGSYGFREKESKVEDIIKVWKVLRKTYPGWTILPHSKREKLWRYTNRFSNNFEIFKSLKPIQDLEYIYELNWRIEKCLFPIWNDMAVFFQTILDQYNIFCGELDLSKPIDGEYLKKNDINVRPLRAMWVELTLSLMRLYREEKQEDNWRNLENQINRILEYIDPDQLARFHYEKVLFHVFEFDHPSALKALKEWQIVDCSPFWEIKRANLLIEFGNGIEARKILETTLNTIRKRLNLSQDINNYSWLSQEAYVIFLLGSTRGNSDEEIRFSLSQTFSERENFLRQYLITPNDELNYFNIILSKTYIPENPTTIKDGFNIGSKSRITRYGVLDEDVFLAYNFLRFTEEIGVPLSSSNIDSKTIAGALTRLSKSSSHWVNAVLSRCSDVKAIEEVFDREYLDYLDVNEIDILVRKFLISFEQLIPESNQSPITRSYLEKIPKLLSRLCVKCSESLRKEIFQFYLRNYSLQLLSSSKKELFINLLNNSQGELSNNFINDLLNLPIERDTTYNSDPFEDIDAFSVKKKFKLPVAVFNNLLKFLDLEKDERQVALKRLLFLFKNKLLSKHQESKLFSILWSDVEENTGFPKLSPFYYFPHRIWPHPNSIDPDLIFRKYINNSNFTIQSNNGKKEIKISRGKDRFAEELLSGSL